MEMTIHSQNLHMNEALEDYARKKLEKLDRYLPNIADVRLDLERERTRRGEDQVIAQITVRHQRGAILRAEERVSGVEQDDLIVAVNQALDKMYRQIQRFKGKRNRKGRERFSATLEEMNVAEAVPLAEEIDEDADETLATEPQVNKRKDVMVTAMTEREAVEQMELLGHTFFLFFNDATGSVNVIYKRRTGDYGVLVPQVG
ncbi:MAG TPA: ribosome-associated translation inhibitor RaiA [Candidatus Limnocylindrales bacterium]|nr:ribosome-associated translation inhibitor RaiA [Candidatus Limnocylindrales bacterium]